MSRKPISAQKKYVGSKLLLFFLTNRFLLRIRGEKAISVTSNFNIFREELQDWAEGDNDKYQQLIDSGGEGRVSVTRNQSFGRVLQQVQQLWRSLSGP